MKKWILDYREKCDACGNYHECNPCEFCAALEANRAAPPPANDELPSVGEQYMKLAHLSSPHQTIMGWERYVAQVAARARLEEAKWWKNQTMTTWHIPSCGCQECKRIRELERGAELQKAVTGESA